MNSAADRLRQRREAKGSLGKLFESANTYVVHYACESFFNRPDGTSPRITSIVFADLQTGQAESFAIHLEAEIKQVGVNQIVQRYDELEKAMLCNFYKFLSSRQNAKFIVWNMRDVNYGFPAIAQRYRALGGQPKEISGADIFDLAEMLQDVYGPTYVKHPHLSHAMKLNAVSDRSFLAGGEEAQAFDQQNYVALHQSTLRKVHVIRELAKRERNGQLKTNAKPRDLYGTRLSALSHQLEESSIIKMLSVVSIIYAVGSAIYFIAQLFSPEAP